MNPRFLTDNEKVMLVYIRIPWVAFKFLNIIVSYATSLRLLLTLPVSIASGGRIFSNRHQQFSGQQWCKKNGLDMPPYPLNMTWLLHSEMQEKPESTPKFDNQNINTNYWMYCNCLTFNGRSGRGVGRGSGTAYLSTDLAVRGCPRPLTLSTTLRLNSLRRHGSRI